MTYTEQLIEFALSDVTPSARASGIVALSSVDWAACGIAGFEEGTFNRWATGQAAFGFSPTFTGEDLTAPNAALVNGTLSHALDFDDTHFGHIGHPSVVVIPSVLAAKPLNWTAFQEAVLIGIEASIRVGLWLGRDHYQRGFHQTATAGAFGACLGACRAMKLTYEQTRHALGLCASMASGLKAQFGTMGKPLNAGLAARAGVDAAMWARGGMTGANDGLEAFRVAHDGAGACAFEGLGSVWEVETLSHKFHACCHGLHATLEALDGVDFADFEGLDIQTHPSWMSVCNQSEPDTGLGAKFSYRQVVAMTIAGHATGNIAAFMDEVAQDPTIVALRDKITVRAADDLTEMQARVTLHATGQVLFHDLAAPLPLDVLETKLRQKTASLIGTEHSEAIWQAQDLSSYIAAVFPTKKGA